MSRHPAAKVHGELASVRSELRDRPGATELYRQALDGFRFTGGDRHPGVAVMLDNLADEHWQVEEASRVLKASEEKPRTGNASCSVPARTPLPSSSR